MANELQIFKNIEFGSVRMLEIDGKPHFVASDIAKALGYSNPRDAILRHCKGVVKRDVPHPQDKSATGTLIKVNIIPEGDVYRLIVHSKLPSAERFEHWVFDDVLPSLRKTGVYAVEEVLNNPDMLITALTKLKEERTKNKALSEQVESQKKEIEACNMHIVEQENQIAELQPKAKYYSVILDCPDVVPISVISKDYGMSAQGMNNLLHRLGIQFKQGDIWLLYQAYANKGYTQTRTHVVTDKKGVEHAKTHTYWTQKGRFFLYEFLSRHGILPTIERNAEEN